MPGSVAPVVLVGCCRNFLWFVYCFSGRLMLLDLVVDIVHGEFFFEEFHLEILVRAPGCHHGYDELFSSHVFGVRFVGDLDEFSVEANQGLICGWV